MNFSFQARRRRQAITTAAQASKVRLPGSGTPNKLKSNPEPDTGRPQCKVECEGIIDIDRAVHVQVAE